MVNDSMTILLKHHGIINGIHGMSSQRMRNPRWSWTAPWHVWLNPVSAWRRGTARRATRIWNRNSLWLIYGSYMVNICLIYCSKSQLIYLFPKCWFSSSLCKRLQGGMVFQLAQKKKHADPTSKHGDISWFNLSKNWDWTKTTVIQ